MDTFNKRPSLVSVLEYTFSKYFIGSLNFIFEEEFILIY